jgi:membrane protein implicated in regulation of membrane protease activity
MASKLVNAVIGSTQSKYAAIILSITVFLLCLSILFMESDYTLGKKLFAILLILLMLLPGLVLTLVEITCIVTGAQNGKNWWCSILAWVIAAFIFIYCIMILITSVNSHYTYKSAGKKVNEYDKGKVMSQEEANDVAEVLLEDIDETPVPIERPERVRPMPMPAPRPSPTPIPPAPQPEPRPMPQPEPRPAPQPGARPMPQPEPRPMPQPEPRPVPQPGARPMPQPEPRPMPQPEPRPVPQPGARPVPQPGARPAPQPGARPVPQPGARPPEQVEPMPMMGIENFSKFN